MWPSHPQIHPKSNPNPNIFLTVDILVLMGTGKTIEKVQFVSFPRFSTAFLMNPIETTTMQDLNYWFCRVASQMLPFTVTPKNGSVAYTYHSMIFAQEQRQTLSECLLCYSSQKKKTKQKPYKYRIVHLNPTISPNKPKEKRRQTSTILLNSIFVFCHQIKMCSNSMPFFSSFVSG